MMAVGKLLIKSSYFIMQFMTTIEVLLYFKDFRNIDLFQQGLYRFRASIQRGQPYMKLD